MISVLRQNTTAPKGWARCALLLLVSLLSFSVTAQDADCTEGVSLQHTFNSGASWSLCAHVSPIDGLKVSTAFFQAPGDLNRSVLAEAQLSQILLHYHDGTVEEPQIVPATATTNSDLISETVPMTELNCDGEIYSTESQPNSICERIKSNGILAKFDQRPAIQSDAWELSAAFFRQTLTWNVSWTFTEDGQINPRLSLSGRSSRRSINNQFAQQTRIDIPSMTRASILSTWRIVTALDTDSPDQIEQFDYPLDIASGNRRPMQITPMSQESFQSMNRENFRGWRIVDESGAGYYLDPANNGFDFKSNSHNWANYTIAVTRNKDCELHAFGNIDSPTSTVNNCGSNLDDFVNEESLTDVKPVIWFNQSRILDPVVEDWPVIRDVQLGFTLLPFDWTASSPFELAE